jgi:hypothetical protein
VSPEPNLGELRAGVDTALDDNVAAQARLARAREQVERVQTTGVGDAAAAQAELEAATAAADSSASSLEEARDSLHELLVDRIGHLGTLETIAPASVPVALLPVGLETRFDGDTLLVRVLPDEIHVEDHEPELTDSEVEAGRGFWTQVWRGGTAEPAATDAERGAWTSLVNAIGSSRRAAWVAERTQPTGGTRPTAAVPADTELPDPPVFDEPPRRAGAWSRPATSRTLPDHFVAIAYRRSGSGGQASWTEIGRASGKPVSDSVQLGFDPSAPAPAVSDTGPALPDGMQWMVDPAAAEAAGLLIRLPLPAGTTEVDRLVVLGVLGSLEAPDASQRLADLFANHHYSRGLELLRVGTPTNNTAAERSGFAAPDDPVASFAVERRTPAPPDGSDGSLLARALGIPGDTLRGVANSGDAEQAAAGQMNALVWPSAFGYWFDSLVQPGGPGDAQIADIRRHAVQMVRGRGPLPPLRVGRQPYGVLPTTSLRSWQPGGEPPGVANTARFLQSTLPWWLDGVLHAPVVRAGQNPDQGILDVLAQSPVSTTVAVRSMVGANVCYAASAAIAGIEAPADEANRQGWLGLVAMRSLGFDGMLYIGHLVGAADPLPLLHLPYAVDPRTPPDQAAAAWQAITTYLRGLRGRGTKDLQSEDPRGFTSLLTLLAKRSVMLERARAGIIDATGSAAGKFVEAHLRLDDAAVMQAQMISTSATLRIGDTRSNVASFLAGSVTQSDGTVLAAVDHIDQQLVTGVIDTSRYAAYAETVQAAEAAAALAPDRAALLLGEALDVASHRFDAWVTSLATRRLSDLRAATPTGVTLGAYGVVEDLVRRQPRAPVAQPPEGAPTPLVVDDSGGGYVHAPSLAQAATAAVLRAGHLSHAARDENAGALALDLSSSRVRTALGLLDGVRQGQALGALLGYRTERLLHERGAHVAVEIVRRLAPPPVVTAAGTPEGLPPSAVCDGLALSRLPRDDVHAAFTGADAGLVPVVDDVLDTLLDAVDAVADLLLAESVHQIVRGNPTRAAGALDVLNRGEGANAEPEVVATPRTGTSLTNRALVLIGHDPPAAPGWPVDGVRARAEPRLAAWAGHLLGDPAGISVVVRSGESATTISLADLGIGALDVVYEPLAPRALRHARKAGVAEGANVDLTEKRLAALLAVAEGIHGLIARARAGTGLDLARPQDRGSVLSGPPPLAGSDAADGALTTSLPDKDAGDRRARLDAARASLEQAVSALDGIAATDPAPPEADVADALDTLACFGIAPGGDPAAAPSAAALSALHDAAAARLAASTAAPDDAAALFGEGFPVLALAAPPFPAALATALAADPVAAVPANVLEPLGGETGALEGWVESYGRVRASVGRLADVLFAARLRRTGGAAQLRAIQQPPEPFPDADEAHRGQWVGVRFPAALSPAPVTNLVAHALGDLDADSGIAVLVVDEFVEVVPAAETTTALSFAFDAPGARPPQTILLAVPPVPGSAWTVDTLAGVIGETIDLAKIRTVDLSAVAWAGRFIPTVYLTDGDVAGGLDLPIRDIVKAAHLEAEALVQP